jgi:lambda family phage tail tape measure protein
MAEYDELDSQIAALELTMGVAASVAASFESELGRMRDSLVTTNREAGSLTSSLNHGLSQAFNGLVFEGETLSDVMRQLAQSMSNTAYNSAVSPVQGATSGAVGEGVAGLLSGVLAFARGGVFSGGRIVPFARGGVVSEATGFAMPGATGVMGEAGPEAIMPLSRGEDGRLGVQAQGGARPVNLVMNIQTNDAQSFQRSQSQIAAQAMRALSRGQRNT